MAAMLDRDARRHAQRQDPDTDHRGIYPAKRDRDRLLYCNALRRLAGVTQVTSPMEGDVVHNRLTHTLKVAQVARRLAERLLIETDPERVRAIGGIDPEVVEAAALAHDLGHPPFGHVGERELDRLLGEQDEEGYEGNAQSFRIVTKLAVHSEAHLGLNLTRATLDALLKYPWLKAQRPDARKWGAYATELEDFQWVRGPAASIEARGIEAQIMDWADDITYAVHDVDDFYRAGIIPMHLLARDDEERAQFLASTRARWAMTHPARIEIWERFADAFAHIMRLMPIRRPYTGTRTEQALLSRIRSGLITRFINAPVIVEPDGQGGARLEIPDDIQAEVATLKALDWFYVIESSAYRSQQQGFRRIVRELFQVFCEDSAGELIPNWLGAELDPDATPARRAADILGALSDVQALRMYHRLSGLTPGSVRDWM
jgi:dGTPase